MVETDNEMTFFDTQEEVVEFENVCRQIVDGVAKTIHRALTINFTTTGGTFTANGKDITLNLNFPICKDEDDLLGCLHHELAHVVFKSDARYIQKVIDTYPDVNPSYIHQIFNILEDVRIEYSWAKIYPGHYKSFLDLRENMRGDDDLFDNPIWILLQIRAGNKNIDSKIPADMIPLVKEMKRLISNVRNGSCLSAAIVTREVLNLLSEFYSNTQPCCMKCGKVMNKKEEDLTSTHYEVSVCNDCGSNDGDGDSESGDTPAPDGDKVLDPYEQDELSRKLDEAYREIEQKGWTTTCTPQVDNDNEELDESSDPNGGHPFSRNRAGGTQAQVDENLSKDFSVKQLSEEQRIAMKRNRKLRNKAIKHMNKLMKTDKTLKQKLREGLKDFGGEHQKEIDQHNWSRSYYDEEAGSQASQKWLGHVRSILGESAYARRIKLHKTGFKIKMKKAVPYIASGMNSNKQKIFLKKRPGGKSLSICYVVDLSGSMYGENTRIVRDIMLTTHEATKQIDTMSCDFIVFESNSRARITDTKLLRTIEAQGGTYATPAIVQGANVLNHLHDGDEKIMIFLSDGGHEEVEKCFDYAATKGVKPFIVCVSPLDKEQLDWRYGKYADNCITVDDYDKAFDEIMQWVLTKIKEQLELK